MFGNLSHLIPPPLPEACGPPKDVPLPTPVHFPQCRPGTPKLHSAESGVSEPLDLSTLLQTLVRPADQVEVAHLEALGVHVTPDISLIELVPDPSYLPDFDKWESMTQEDIHVLGAESRPVLCNDKLGPGALKYRDLQQGLLTENNRAFRSVRRVTLKAGEQYARLGYCHDFFRCLETLTGFWDDPSIRKPSTPSDEKVPADGDGNADKATGSEGFMFYRTSTGAAMPAHCRTQLLTSFLQLVTYEFCCSVTSRQEPRLYLKSPGSDYRRSYFSSGCNFVYRMPIDRESASRGIIEGPIAAVSPRHTTVFPPTGRERDSVIDLSREIIAALITAQHRAREGRQEERIGKDAWWATRPRWGGGPGGPIGKEAEILDSKDATNDLVEGNGPCSAKRSSPPAATGQLSSRGSSLRGSSSRAFGGLSPLQPPDAKRPRKGLAIYDAYRMVRPPAMHWDPKTRYAAIGRQRGVKYDDVFVVSSLFHHISILRVRVPDRLLEVLSGSAPDPGVSGRGRVEVWRTRWFDFFIAQDRVEAMRAVWAIMAYAMRKTQHDKEMGEEEDRKILSDGEAKEGSRG